MRGKKMKELSKWESESGKETAVFTETKQHELVIKYSKEETISSNDCRYSAMMTMPTGEVLVEEINRPLSGSFLRSEQVDVEIFACLGRWLKARIAERFEGSFDG
jgi:hypothetical protein